MLSRKLFLLLAVSGVFAMFYCNSIDENDGSDSKWDCRNFNFNNSLNITIDERMVVVFNSALCKRCSQKLLSFKALQLLFEIADYNNIVFIMLTTEYYGSKKFDELQSKAGDIVVVSLHDIDNDFFVAGSVYVFDKCSRLTYELIPPWSDMQYHLVKAAILSTWYSSPCGECESDSEELAEILQYENDLATTTDTDSENFDSETEPDAYSDYEVANAIQVQSNDSAYVANLQIIMPLIHVHYIENNTYIKYNYVVHNSNNNSESSHNHLSSDQTEELYDNEILTSLNSTETKPPEYLKNAEGLRFKVTVSKPQLNSTANTYLEVRAEHDIVVVTPPPKLTNSTMTNTINSSILAKLEPWLFYRLLNQF